MYPTITDYNRVLQKNNGSAFTTLHNLVFVPSRTVPAKIFTYGSGSYAVIFKAKEDDKQFAIRCFISANQENYFRYKKLHGYLKNISALWVTQFQFLENEICVNNETYPVIKMDWVDGLLLNDYISQILYNNEAIEKLQKAIVRLSENLEEINVGHGDIQCGNVIITKHSNGKLLVKLIDYDGMFIPAFRNKTNLERGRTEFQHPNRSSVNFDEKIDRFSFWVIIAALEALKHDKTLWLPKMQGGFNSSDNLLFDGLDFVNFNQSSLVSKLYSLNNSALNYYLQQLGIFCNGNPNDVTTPTLFSGQVITKVSDETWTKVFNSEHTIQFITNISGVIVLNSSLKKIGVTPLTLNKADALGKSFVLVSGDNKKTVTVANHHKIIDVSFPLDSNTKLGTEPKIVKPPERPKIVDDKAKDSQAKKGHFDIFEIVLVVIVFLLVIAVIYALVKENKSSNDNPVATTTEVPTTTIDTTVTSDTARVDYNIVDINNDQLKTCFGKVAMVLDLCHDNAEYSSPINFSNSINFNTANFLGLWNGWGVVTNNKPNLVFGETYRIETDPSLGLGSDEPIMWSVKFFSNSKVFITYHFQMGKDYSEDLDVLYDLNLNEYIATYLSKRIVAGVNEIKSIDIENDKVILSKNEESLITTEKRNEIFTLINKYYQFYNSNCYQAADFYVPIVENYFGKSNQTINQITNECTEYHSRWPYTEMTIYPSSFQVTPFNHDYYVSFNGFYKAKKSTYDDWSTFNSAINITLSPDLKIKSITEKLN